MKEYQKIQTVFMQTRRGLLVVRSFKHIVEVGLPVLRSTTRLKVRGGLRVFQLMKYLKTIAPSLCGQLTLTWERQ